MAVIITKSAGSGKPLYKGMVFGEHASGSKNHSNTTFTTLYTYITGTLQVYYNGQVLDTSEFTELSSNSFSLVYVMPYSDDHLSVSYLKN